MNVARPILVALIGLALVSCAPASMPVTPLSRAVTGIPTPISVITVPTLVPLSTPEDWKDRIRACITRYSFLTPILPQLDRYEDHNNPIEVSVSIVPTHRGCITLPEDLYPVAQRELVNEKGDAFLGYISNWEPVCGGFHTGPLPGNCTGDGYEGGGTGTVILRARSAVPSVPDLIFHFVMTPSP